MKSEITIIGGGLAGCEAAWQLAIRGHHVVLFEMRPFLETGAHKTSNLAELVCSNSFGSTLINRPSGLLQKELTLLHSLLVDCALQTSLPAGSALAVDRNNFSRLVESSISTHPNIEIIREEVTILPRGYSIIASGPLSSERLSAHLSESFGSPNLFFYDALAPIISSDSIDMTIAFKASRYNRGQKDEGDYINCPFSREQYNTFISALLKADLAKSKPIINEANNVPARKPNQYFEGCLPIEVLAKRGENALAYGPMRPVGLRRNSRDDQPFAIVQLRQDNLAGSLYNIVGFQTNLTYKAQTEVFRLIPGLEHAEFIRFGQMHRNTFINSPVLLQPTLQLKDRPKTFVAGQIAGFEGYLGSVASGLVSGINLSRLLKRKRPVIFPQSTMIGSLLWYISNAEESTFQPMKANFGILPSLPDHIRDKMVRNTHLANGSVKLLEHFINENDI